MSSCRSGQTLTNEDISVQHIQSVQNIQSVRIFQYKIFSGEGYFSTKYSVDKVISVQNTQSVQNIQSVRIFQCKIFSGERTTRNVLNATD